METNPYLIFCSYASPDKSRIVPYVDGLEDRNFDVWVDFRKLKAGQDWDREIKRALSKAVIIIAFVSSNSINRRGYVQRELKLALDKYNEKLSGDIYLIPVLLDEEIGVPDDIQHLQCVKVWETAAVEQIDEAIRHQLSVLGASVRETQEKSKIRWSLDRYHEMWDGLPGYEADVSFISLASREYNRIEDIGYCIQGELSELLMELRRTKFRQDTNRYDFGLDRSFRSNTLDVQFSDPVIVGKIITIQYAVHQFRVGAEHGSTSLVSKSFLIDPVVRIETLREIFEDDRAAFDAIQ
jgi:hypothetical protein